MRPNNPTLAACGTVLVLLCLLGAAGCGQKRKSIQEGSELTTWTQVAVQSLDGKLHLLPVTDTSRTEMPRFDTEVLTAHGDSGWVWFITRFHAEHWHSEGKDVLDTVGYLGSRARFCYRRDRPELPVQFTDYRVTKLIGLRNGFYLKVRLGQMGLEPGRRWQDFPQFVDFEQVNENYGKESVVEHTEHSIGLSEKGITMHERVSQERYLEYMESYPMGNAAPYLQFRHSHLVFRDTLLPDMRMVVEEVAEWMEGHMVLLGALRDVRGAERVRFMSFVPGDLAGQKRIEAVRLEAEGALLDLEVEPRHILGVSETKPVPHGPGSGRLGRGYVVMQVEEVVMD